MEAKKAQAKFKFKVNNGIYETDVECPNGAQILTIAGFDKPSDYDLILIRRGQEEIISLHQTVCLSDPGVERFRARPKKVNDGYKGSESSLSLKDTNYLDNSFEGRWEFKKLDNLNILYLRNFRIPEGYNVQEADMILIVPDRYDSVQLDMAYFKPHLSRADKKPLIKATPRKFGDEIFQQWSRHRTNDNPWIIGIDCIETHIDLITFFLRKELER
jgi:hypothetical protein